MAGEVADRLVDEVGGEVVAGRVVAGGGDVGVVAHQLGGVLVGLGVEEPVVAVEAAPERPPVERPGRARLGEPGDVPLADEVVAVAVRPQELGEGRDVGGDLAAVAGEPAVEVGEAAHADRVVVAARQQCRPRRRAHRGRVEPGVAEPLGGEPVDGRRGDLGAVATEVGEPDVVEHDEQHVGALRWRRRRRPPRRRVLDRGSDAPFELAGRHALEPICVRRTREQMVPSGHHLFTHWRWRSGGGRRSGVEAAVDDVDAAVAVVGDALVVGHHDRRGAA